MKPAHRMKVNGKYATVLRDCHTEFLRDVLIKSGHMREEYPEGVQRLLNLPKPRHSFYIGNTRLGSMRAMANWVTDNMIKLLPFMPKGGRLSECHIGRVYDIAGWNPQFETRKIRATEEEVAKEVERGLYQKSRQLGLFSFLNSPIDTPSLEDDDETLKRALRENNEEESEESEEESEEEEEEVPYRAGRGDGDEEEEDDTRGEMEEDEDYEEESKEDDDDDDDEDEEERESLFSRVSALEAAIGKQGALIQKLLKAGPGPKEKGKYSNLKESEVRAWVYRELKTSEYKPFNKAPRDLVSYVTQCEMSGKFIQLRTCGKYVPVRNERDDSPGAKALLHLAHRFRSKIVQNKLRRLSSGR